MFVESDYLSSGYTRNDPNLVAFGVAHRNHPKMSLSSVEHEDLIRVGGLVANDCLPGKENPLDSAWQEHSRRSNGRIRIRTFTSM